MSDLLTDGARARRKTRRAKTERTPPAGGAPEEDRPSREEFYYAQVLNERYDLNLSDRFLRYRPGIKLLIKCFGFHKDEDYAAATGNARIRALRQNYYVHDDPEWLARKLNQSIDNDRDWLTPDDVAFMVGILNGSDHPLLAEDMSVDPEDIYYATCL